MFGTSIGFLFIVLSSALSSTVVVRGADRANDTASLLVRLSYGDIEGKLITAENGREGIGFFGIPYAQPPLGELRFRKPVPPKPWTGVRSCKEYRDNCWQVHTTLAGENFRGIEDCLYLNVFAGVNCSRSMNRCPVLFYIHGGAWEFDTPSVFIPEMLVDNFASHDLVMVTIAYRLNVFGFWSSGGDEAQGNYGIHDMLAGLRWVQREIREFGGDPNKVTIMGHSSGGFTVSLLSISPVTEGLFHQGVMMSGNGVQDGMLENSLDHFRRVAESVGCANETQTPWRDWADDWRRHAVVECMRRVDMDRLGFAYLNRESLGRTGPRNDGPGGIFPLPVSKLVQNRRPMTALTGTTLREMGNTADGFVNATADTVMGLCRALAGSLVRGHRQQEAITVVCLDRYVLPYVNRTSNIIGSPTGSNIWATQTQRLAETAVYYSSCFKDASTLRRKGSRVYLYSFDYEKTGQEGVSPYHAFDLTYLIGVHPFPFDDRDRRIQRVYAPLFANFVKYGEPTPSDSEGFEKWTPLAWPFGFNYYSVNLPGPTMKPDYHKEDIEFFNYIVPLLEKGRSVKQALRSLDDRVEAAGNGRWGGLATWHAAFVVVLTVLGVAVFGTMTMLVRLTVIRRRRVRSMENAEAVELISEITPEVSYQTF